MENKFEQMALAVSRNNEVDSEMNINDLKAKRDQIMKTFDFKINELEAQKTEQKAFQNQVKSEQKKNKIRTEMITSMLEAQGGEGSGSGVQPQDQSSGGVFIGRQPA